MNQWYWIRKMEIHCISKLAKGEYLSIKAEKLKLHMELKKPKL